MAKRTFLQLAQRVYQECSAPGSPPSSVTNQLGLKEKIVDWTADAAYEIEALWGDWNFSFKTWEQTLTQGSDSYTLPTDHDTFRKDSVYVSSTSDGDATDDFWVIHEMGFPAWWVKYRPLDATAAANQGKPAFFIISPDGELKINPAPDDTYYLSALYHAVPTRLAANGDYSAIPEQFEQAIIALAKMKFAEHEGAQTMLVNAQAEYDLWLSALETNQRPRQGHRRSDNEEPLVVRAV